MKTYLGQHESEPLLEWLNQARISRKARDPYADLAKLAALLGAIPHLAKEYLPYYRGSKAAESHEAAQVIAKTATVQDQCNELLRRYSAKPSIAEVRLGADRIFLHWLDARSRFTVQRRIFESVTVDFTELDAALAIIRLAEIGAISRLRQCDVCARWFLAKYEAADSHSSCSSECRSKKQQAPKFKEGRAAYMRTYRQRNREREKRQEALLATKRKRG